MVGGTTARKSPNQQPKSIRSNDSSCRQSAV